MAYAGLTRGFWRMKVRCSLCVLAAPLVCVLFAGRVSAADDGFSAGRTLRSKHFAIELGAGVSETVLDGQLAVSPGDAIIAGTSGRALPDRVDTLFTRVCDILDMRLYSYTGTIKVCKDEKQLGSVYSSLFGRDIPLGKSFYAHDLNTIYITEESFIRGIIGHEFAHAVMNHYFVVLPPEKIQELLSGYVEFQLRSGG